MLKPQFNHQSPFVSSLMMAPTAPGALNHLKFCVKDVIAVNHHVNSLGNPTWARLHQPATRNALSVRRCLAAGATLRGMTISDEFMFSIKGSNVHYGDPFNPQHPGCFSGGSSSGSASAVASGLVDFGLGTDTGGSIRVPASYCGLYGFRPTHTTALLDGVAPLATSFDTVGILARQGSILSRVGHELYSNSQSVTDIKRVYDLAGHPSTQVYQQETAALMNGLQLSPARLYGLKLPAIFSPERLLAAFQRIQGFEAWHEYGDWLTHHQAHLGADTAAHFKAAAEIEADTTLENAYRLRSDFSVYLNDLLTDGGLLVLPTTSTPAPAKQTPFSKMEIIRAQTQQLTVLAGLAGVPQVVIPGQNGQSSLSIISAAGTDHALLELADASQHWGVTHVQI